MDTPADETRDAAGATPPHWRALLAALEAIGAAGLRRHADRLARAFAEEGAAGPSPGSRSGPQPGAWRCDPAPLLLSGAEFARLETGLAQRARLLEALLADLYGPQATLADGVLPAPIAFANPGFLRPCRHLPGPWLHVYAADLARGPDGAWRVLADHVDAPAGLGRAIENRRAMTRVLPGLFPAGGAGDAAPFFALWRDALTRLAPPDSPPGVALLTAGPSDPDWFEHVLLARELSCALVEPNDLSARDGAVFLKTLRGPLPVRVLMRHLPGDCLDPLEFGGQAQGVPGLLDAMREGGARMANAPGAALAEAPGLAAFLPALCERLLGEAPALAGPAALWLGRDGALESALARPDAWLARPACAPGPARPLAAMADAARRAPWRFVASERMAPSVAPCAAEDGRMTPRPVVLRLFLAFDGARWRAMRGGLAFAPDPGWTAGAPLPPGLAKDVWIVDRESDPTRVAAHPARPTLPVRRRAGDLPSRVAEDFFWMGRYLERAENAARLQRAALARLRRAPPDQEAQARDMDEVGMMACCLAHAGLLEPPPGMTARELAADAGAAGRLLLEAGPERMAARLAGLLRQLAGNAERLRGRLTGDMQAAIAQLLPGLVAGLQPAPNGMPGETTDDADPSDALSAVLRFAAMLAGLAAENMVRGGGHLFLDLGRRMERAQAVAALAAAALAGAPFCPERLESGLRTALELCDSLITYRNRYLTVMQPGPALDLVLLDQGNPRGLAYQLLAMRDRLAELDDAGRNDAAGGPGAPGDARGMAGAAFPILVSELGALVGMVLAAPDQNRAAASLPPRLRAVAETLAGLSDRIARSYFALLPAAHTVGFGAPDEPAEDRRDHRGEAA